MGIQQTTPSIHIAPQTFTLHILSQVSKVLVGVTILMVVVVVLELVLELLLMVLVVVSPFEVVVV